ncbi:MAG: LysE family translocator [Burkholderiaceae bacterium]|jgi:threonine/homoserine/homoserine lactone efflux protein|nr:LysE family translocator [Burkholderiaceae bacterium]MDP3133169.1 LysE family translocator [Burkholderiaceae bacterium]MDP3424581.1 LysE family translocator [Burkholderiaceae bacterium]MDZ4162355.1 LysE family translocator [Burkholderiales bacterium]
MSLGVWWLFVGMTFVVSATPGPNMLYVMSLSARLGVRTAVSAMAGCMTALLAMMTLSAAGLGALLQSFPAVFDALRLAGAAYLAYLGVKCWRTPVQGPDDLPAVGAEKHLPLPPKAQQLVPSRWAVYRQGFLVAASNPKAILFAAAFFPQFIHADLPKLPQFAVLLATFTVIEVGWYFVYAVSGKQLSVYLQRAAIMRLFNRVTGGAFVGFAALMATTKS